MSNTQDFNKNNTDNTDNTDGIAGRDPVRALRYWLRAVDALTAREVQARFAEAGASRRDLRVLNLLSSEREIPERLSARLERGGKRLWSLADRGWIARADAADNTAASMGWKLTEAGELAQANLTRIVQEVRDRVSGAVTADDFETTVASLEAMARELGWAEGMRLPRSGRGRGSGHRRQGYQNGHGHGHRHGHGHDRHQSHHHGHDHRQGYHNGHDHPQEREHCSGRGYSRGQGHSHPYDRGRGVAQEHGAWRDCGHGRGSNRGFDSGYYGGDHGGDHGGHRGGHRGGRGERSVAFERGFAAGFAAGRPQA